MFKEEILDKKKKGSDWMYDKLADIMTMYYQGLKLFPYWTDESVSQWEKDCFHLFHSVTEETSEIDFFKGLMKVSGTLNDGHTLIFLPRNKQNRLYPPCSFRVIQDELVMEHALDTYHSYCFKGIKTINGEASDLFIQKISEHYWKHSINLSLHYYQQDSCFWTPELSYRIVFNTGETVELPFTTDTINQKRTPIIGDVWCEEEGITLQKIGNKALVTLTHFMSDRIVDNFYAYVNDLSRCEEIIFDVRGNVGGNSDYANQLTQSLYNGAYDIEKVYQQVSDGETYASATMLFYTSDELPKNATKEEEIMSQAYHYRLLKESMETCDKKEYKGLLAHVPVTVLQDDKTYSSGENFIMNIDAHNRGSLIGTQTAGSTGQPAWIKLRTGGVFMVTAKRVEYPNGKKHHNQGIEPGIKCTPTLEELKQGIDRALEVALSR